jgi:hypothetical protein
VRTVSSALSTELANTITEVGYLVEINLASVQRWSNIGQVSWNAQTWLDRSFEIGGLDFNAESELTARLAIANHDGVAGALFIDPTESMYDLTVTIYQFARGALGASDVPLIATMAVDACRITPDRVTLDLAEVNTDAQFSPRRRIAPSEGFSFATPAGVTIPWGNETYTVEPSDG